MDQTTKHKYKKNSGLTFRVTLISIFFLLVACAQTLKAQYFNVFDIDSQNFPTVTAKYILKDSAGNQVYSAKKNQFNILENRKNAKQIEVIPPQKEPPHPLSVVLSFDVSYSMNKQRLKIAREAGEAFIKLLPLHHSECAITSFDEQNYLNQDFTRNPERLSAAVASLKAQGGTNYNSGFITPFAGALNIAKDGDYKRVVIFLTDGMGKGKAKHIIERANEHNITVYPVTVEMKMPDILKKVAEQTGGKYYEKIHSPQQAKAIYKEILFSAQSTSHGIIKWRSNAGCQRDISAVFSMAELIDKKRYQIRPDQLHRLNVAPKYLTFTSDQDTLKETTLSAQNGSFTILDFTFDKPHPFDIPLKKTIPHRLKKGEKLSVDIVRKKQASGTGFLKLAVKNNKCPDNFVYIKMGQGKANIPLLELIEPNGGETLIAGRDTIISWKGIAESDSAILEFSRDNGQTWKQITRTNGLKTSWKVPAIISPRNRIRVNPATNKNRKLQLESLYTLSGKEYKAHNARFIKNDQFIISANDDHSLSLWEGNSGKHIQSVKYHDRWVYDATEHPSKNLVVTASDDGYAKVFNFITGQGKQILHANTWGLNKALFVKKGKQVVTAGDDGMIRLWNMQNDETDIVFRAHNGWVLDLAKSPDGKYTASVGDDRMLKIWDLTEKTRVMTILAHKNWVYDVEYSSDGTKLITASKDSTVRIWNAKNGQLIQTINDFYDEVFSASFSPNDKYFVTASKDGTMRIYHTSSGELMEFTKLKDDKWFLKAAFDHSGERIISTNNDRVVKIWGVEKQNAFKPDISDAPFRIISPLPEIEAINFQGQLINRSKDTLIPGYLKNPLSHPVYIKNITITGQDKESFQLISPGGEFTIPPDSSKAIEIQFSPKTPGRHQAIISASTAVKTISRDLTGTGKIPGYQLLNDYIDFGLVKLQHTKDTTIPILQNTGNYPLKITDLKLVGHGKEAFNVLDMLPSNHLPPGKRVRVNMAFQPLFGERSNAKVQIHLSGYPEPEYINLIGEGAAPKAITIQGHVRRITDSMKIAAKVQVADLKGNIKIDSAVVKPKTPYSFRLIRDRKFRISATKPGYIPAGIHINLQKHQSHSLMNRDIYLSQIKVGAKVRLNNIFFEYDKSRLTSSSKGELEQVREFLKRHPSVMIEVAGHTDNQGSNSYNSNLSLARARAVKKYLVARGIEEERIKSAGYGESRPIATNSTPQGRELNRRVEFKIIQKD